MWFIFYDRKLALLSGGYGPPKLPHGPLPPVDASGLRHSLGSYEGVPCIAFEAERLPDSAPWTLVDLREAYVVLGEKLYALAGKGRQLIHWDWLSRFCAHCGVETVLETQNSKRCPICGNAVFPSVSTAVLVLVRKEDSILLVRAHNFRGPFYGLVAGYLEPGETLEQCAAREVLEETSLAIGNISYFGCQPWPFPSNLMVGFSADYLSGDLVIQQSELSEAAFYTRDNLPTLPSTISLTRRMIDWWVLEGK